MKRILFTLAVLAALSGPTFADQTIDALSAAGAIVGTESIPAFQTANPAVKTTPNALDTYLSQTTKTLTNKTLTSPTINAAALSGTFSGAPTFSGNVIFSGVPKYTGLSAGTIASGKNLGLDSSNNLVVATVSGGGGSVSVTAGTPTVVVTPSPGTGTFTVGTTIADATDTNTTSYTVVAGNMGGAERLAATSGTPALILPAVSATIFQPGMSFSFAIDKTAVSYSLTNSTGLTLKNLNSTTLAPGASGTFVANANATDLDFYPGTQIATTSVIGGAKLHNVPVSLGWVATVNPTNTVIAVINQASTVSAIIGAVETATGSAATVTVNKAPSGTACSAGTALHSGTFNANGTAATNQTLTVTTSALAAGDRLCLQTTGTTSWTGGTGIGTITVFLAPS